MSQQQKQINSEDLGKTAIIRSVTAFQDLLNKKLLNRGDAAEMARKLGISPATVKNWKEGTPPGLEGGVLAASYLGLRADELFEKAEKPELAKAIRKLFPQHARRITEEDLYGESGTADLHRRIEDLLLRGDGTWEYIDAQVGAWEHEFNEYEMLLDKAIGWTHSEGGELWVFEGMSYDILASHEVEEYLLQMTPELARDWRRFSNITGPGKAEFVFFLKRSKKLKGDLVVLEALLEICADLWDYNPTIGANQISMDEDQFKALSLIQELREEEKELALREATSSKKPEAKSSISTTG